MDRSLVAPEHPFPAPLEDCWIAWMWLRRNAARFDLDPARVVLGGQSAGGDWPPACVSG